MLGLHSLYIVQFDANVRFEHLTLYGAGGEKDPFSWESRPECTWVAEVQSWVANYKHTVLKNKFYSFYFKMQNTQKVARLSLLIL